ncbi:hypothetical protein Cali_255 [Mycobacterium phage Cali]|uniref:Uncharacterized protein n=27 Tax=Bixzunavirus TaxID=680114 RepID=Q852V4_BPMBZ|nr:gp251 [Mycobacterium phage Bxz1]YP_002224253.1 hypothetical protein SCOTTMCG_256 [Mycobacterium phage ScottMcG]YP_002224476.1 gp257 [Mycobacterium phage Spud]YP_002224697.1 gp255 [Mycobacterium phage Cali]YP_008061494.1 hypothetical protein M180_gp086 [Mycobacterium phage ArcherS7]YP_008061726.1 hypothetical protein M182_gp084 [Mycobacterium phage Astraea]YP_009014819.1 hypothetical protein LINSTU_261 [Mycobacterium phage LinStu]YP_009017562.1 hypothetical protein MOMOMIXON_260 [Mycobacte
MSDTNRLLQDALDAARDADSDLTECLPLPDDLDEFLDEWDVPAEDREMFKGLAVEFESVVMALDDLIRRLREKIEARK